MKAEELRIGNLVLELRELEVVGKRTFGNWDAFNLEDHLHPIPLTEDWLTKAGFIQDIDDFCIYPENGSKFIIKRYREFFTNRTMCFKYMGTEIKYVHQIQNLYFALTGEEIKFNL